MLQVLGTEQQVHRSKPGKSLTEIVLTKVCPGLGFAFCCQGSQLFELRHFIYFFELNYGSISTLASIAARGTKINGTSQV